jgi:hypothetical protein
MDFIKGYMFMPAYKIKWSDLLFLSELEFIGDAPKELVLTNELLQVVAFLTGATGHDRRFLRCNDNGALLVGNAWDNLVVAENDELYILDYVPDTFVATKPNKGVLVAPRQYLIKATFIRVQGGYQESIYVPPYCLFYYPHSVYSIIADCVPSGAGMNTYVGITTFN